MKMWRDIWEKKGKTNISFDKITLRDLISIDGFDTGAGTFRESDWLEYADYIKTHYFEKKNNSIFEIGCGAGALLFALQMKDTELFGLDYSEKLIEIIKKIFPSGIFKNCEASELAVQFKGYTFDVIVSNSVFQYFPDYNYAESVIKSSYQKLNRGGRLVLLDLNDAVKKDQFIKIRRETLGETCYNELYRGLDQLFIDKDQIRKSLQNIGFTKIFMEDQKIRNYKNSQFRYNIVGVKPG